MLNYYCDTRYQPLGNQSLEYMLNTIRNAGTNTSKPNTRNIGEYRGDAPFFYSKNPYAAHALPRPADTTVKLKYKITNLHPLLAKIYSPKINNQ